MSIPIDFSTVGVATMRQQGYSDDDIATALNIHPNLVKSVPLPRPQPQRQRSVQHAQLMQMQRTLMPKVEAGDVDAMLTLLKVQKREADLLGLDAPKEVISTNFNMAADVEGMTPEQVKELTIDQIKHMLLVKLGQLSDPIDVTPEQP